MNDAGFELIKHFVFSETGLVYYRDKEAELLRKVNRALKHSGSPDYLTYLKLLEKKDEEGSKAYDDLISALTIGETHFFRDEAMFKGLLDVVLPEVVNKNQNRKRLWIWSAGCATGEEAYTVSILLNEHYPHLLKDWDVRILGTDINRAFLYRALQGEYTNWSLRGTLEEIQRDCFIQSDRTWRIKPKYKETVSFQYHNLITMPVPSVFHNLFEFDIIFCRNVMIYFDLETNQSLVKKLQKALARDGWLIVGHADHNIRLFTSYKTVMLPGTSLYQNTPFNTVEYLNNQIGPLKSPTETNSVGQDSDFQFNFKPLDLPDFTPSVAPRTVSLEALPKIEAESPPPREPPDSKKLSGLINKGDWENASPLCEELLSIRPLDPEIHLLAALIMAQKGLTNEAIASLRKAIYLDRNYIVGHYHLGLMLQLTGDFKKAEKCFENVIRLLKDHDENFVFEIADGISANQLKRLSAFHIQVLTG